MAPNTVNLYLGGSCFSVEFPDVVPEGLRNSVFATVENPIVFDEAAIPVKISYDSLDAQELARWQQEKFAIDTRSTWALAFEKQEARPFHMAPSPSVEFDAASLHLYASENFRELEIFYGDWRNEYQDRWLFYPYEQAIFIHLLQFSGTAALTHASAAEIDGKGYLFLGDSGAGKSTIASLCEDELGAKRIYSDDRIIVRKHNDKWFLFGTPWNGSFARTRAEGIEIGGMYFLEQKPTHEITLLTPAQAISRLLPVVFGTWWLPERLPQHMHFVNEIATQTQFPLYRLGFNLTDPILPFLRKHRQ